MKDTEALSDLLFEFEKTVTDEIRLELQRIKRPVKVNELPCVPFHQEIKSCAATIRLDVLLNPVVDTTFEISGDRYLTAFISDHIISHRKMITLLGMLQQING